MKPRASTFTSYPRSKRDHLLTRVIHFPLLTPGLRVKGSKRQRALQISSLEAQTQANKYSNVNGRQSICCLYMKHVILETSPKGPRTQIIGF